MPYERPQNSVEIAIFRVAKEGPLKISRSSGNDAELLFLCSFNSVSEFFCRLAKIGYQNRIAQRWSFRFFCLRNLLSKPQVHFLVRQDLSCTDFFSPSLLEPVAPCTLTLFECLQPEVWKFSESATLLVFLGPRVEIDVLPGWDQHKFPEVVLVTNSEVSRSQCPELCGSFQIGEDEPILTTLPPIMEVENGCISNIGFLSFSR